MIRMATKKALAKLASYRRWRKRNRAGVGPSFHGQDLSNVSLRGKDLSWINFWGSLLAYADLEGATLQYVDLSYAHLVGCNLCGADLRYSNLQDTDLRDVCLIGADLRGASLPAPTMLLLARWEGLSDATTRALMRLDCASLPGGRVRFREWARRRVGLWGSDPCPYTGARVQRVANFSERRKVWKAGPPPSIWTCCKMVLDEACPGWDNPPDIPVPEKNW